MQKLPVKFRARAFELKSSEAMVIVHKCCMCGNFNAPFGKGCKLRGHDRTLGYWFCEDNGQCYKQFQLKFPDYKAPANPRQQSN